ncbi:MAG: tRNA (N6-threonylcarbamoyladenosine(37)-N6)-methyltransferase TrmO [Victivallales bacterium]|nr:tRNA (N6-threonylcarbamoyladenosine(37)-N6)-methyltransferase TrmO [Victivallales bacterium]
MEGTASYQFSPVGMVHSCYRTKFGIPRQSGLIAQATGTIELLPPCNQPNIIRGLEEFSHIWVIFIFHQNLRKEWKATVRPPRLGGDSRLGVFATRSPFRPVPIGLSAMRLEGIEQRPHGKLFLKVSGMDLVDGTPVLDIKPYLPYADAIPDATGGFAPTAPEASLRVTIAPEAEAVLALRPPAFRELCVKVVSADPRPAYQRIPGREYQCYLEDCEILWRTGDDVDEACIIRINPDTPPPQFE